MSHDEHHEHLVKEVEEIFLPILSDSKQAIYIYLDDTHKTCNQNLVDLLGYENIDEWISTESPISDFVESDQENVIEAYGNATEKYEASTVSAAVKTRGGSEIETEIFMMPFSYKGEVFVVHFINELKN